MMKKITAIILAAVMLLSALSLASCTKEEITAKLIYDKMNANLLALDAFEAKMSIEMDMGVAGQDVTVKTSMDYDIKADGIGTDAPVAYADIKIDMLGQTVRATSYTEGDYIYITSEGEGMKLPKNSELAADYDATTAINAYEIDIPDEMLEASAFTTDEEGNYVLSFAIGGDRRDILDDLIKNIMSGMDASLSDYELEIGDVKYVLVADKDFAPKSMKMDITMNVTAQGMEMSIDCSASCEYLAFGDSVTVTPPEGYQDFEELVA